MIDNFQSKSFDQISFSHNAFYIRIIKNQKLRNRDLISDASLIEALCRMFTNNFDLGYSILLKWSEILTSDLIASLINVCLDSISHQPIVTNDQNDFHF